MQKNVGIELLRFILCFWIVIIHCSNIKKEHKKYLKKGFHVPTFFLISFYFFYPTLEGRKITKIISRFHRLLYPYILWPLIIVIMNNIIKFISPGLVNKYFSLYDIYIQILTGSGYHKIFWFQFNLLFLSLFLSIISFTFKKNFFIVLKFIGVISLYLHFSGIFLKYFNTLPIPYKRSLGSPIELISLTVIGSIFGSINLLLKILNFPLYLNLILFFLVHLLFKYDFFISYPGIMYSNILLNIHSSTILFLSFGSLTFDKFKVIIPIIKNISKFTGGIYYIK